MYRFGPWGVNNGLPSPSLMDIGKYSRSRDLVKGALDWISGDEDGAGTLLLEPASKLREERGLDGEIGRICGRGASSEKAVALRRIAGDGGEISLETARSTRSHRIPSEDLIGGPVTVTSSPNSGPRQSSYRSRYFVEFRKPTPVGARHVKRDLSTRLKSGRPRPPLMVIGRYNDSDVLASVSSSAGVRFFSGGLAVFGGNGGGKLSLLGSTPTTSSTSAVQSLLSVTIELCCN